MKITEKVSFNFASEVSNVYILSGQKFIKNAKISRFWRVFEKLKLAVKQCYQTGQLQTFEVILGHELKFDLEGHLRLFEATTSIFANLADFIFLKLRLFDVVFKLAEGCH